MKKISLIIIGFMVLTISIYPKVKFFVDLTGNYLKPADTGYAKIYGEKVFYPELISGLKLYKGLFAYVAYGKLDLKGDITEAGEGVNATSKQSFLSTGIGYEFMYDNKISLKISGGVVFVKYEGKAYLSDALIDEDTGKKTGYKFDLGLYYNFVKNVNIGILAGYFHAQDTQNYFRKLSYGGLKLGLSLGVRF